MSSNILVDNPYSMLSLNLENLTNQMDSLMITEEKTIQENLRNSPLPSPKILLQDDKRPPSVIPTPTVLNCPSPIELENSKTENLPYLSALIVDDTNTNQHVMKKIISSKNYICDTANNIEEAKEALSSKTYSLIVMDNQLGDLQTGLQLLVDFRNHQINPINSEKIHHLAMNQFAKIFLWTSDPVIFDPFTQDYTVDGIHLKDYQIHYCPKGLLSKNQMLKNLQLA
jgi:CheY-like chemotaxis protein